MASTHPKGLTHFESAPFPFDLRRSDTIHVPQNWFRVQIKCMRERVTPGTDHTQSLPTTTELAINDIKEGDGEGREEESDEDGWNPVLSLKGVGVVLPIHPKTRPTASDVRPG